MGDVLRTFKTALAELESGGLSSIRTSSVYRTAAVGCKPGTADFLNAVAAGRWNGTLAELHALCKKTEVASGRPGDHARFDSRTLDIDIIFFGDLVCSDADLTVPHREAAARLFVLIPLAELLGGCNFPGKGRTVGEILREFKNTEEYKLVSAARLPFPK